MAKKGGNQRQYTEDWFLSKGYTKNADGSYQPPKFVNPLTKPVKETYDVLASSAPGIRNVKMSGEIIKKEIEVTNTTSVNKPLESVIVIDGLVAGLNGDKGLMRSHWSDTKKKKELYGFIIGDHLRDGKARQHEGKVTIQYIGYKSILMDWDNFCSSFKHIGDSLVERKIIQDDKPSFVIQFIPQQIKCKRDEQKVVIIIKDYV